MKQLLQQIDSGATIVRDIPAPLCGPGEVLIANEASLVSAGTEKTILELSKKSLLGKARERPDHVKRVLEKLRNEGIRDTLAQVRAKLADPMSLGYSSAGVVLEVGSDVCRFRPGDRVASNGAHAEVVAVAQNLVARVPDGVPFEHACYAVVGAIALQGVRLAPVTIGDRVAVIGLGLIGQITVMLLRAAGCHVIGTDPDASKRHRARELGATVAERDGFGSVVAEATDGNGADAVIVTASTSSSEPIVLAAQVARKKARIVAVGAVGLDVPRREFYPKELELVVSCSYGPGRYDARYEEGGHDYPYPYVRWTEQRNIEAVLEQIAVGGVDVSRLTTHTFELSDAVKAYDLIESSSEPYLGIVLTYPPAVKRQVARTVALGDGRRAPRKNEDVGIGFIGAGNFASLVLLPALTSIPGVRPRVICSAGGVSASIRGERSGFEVACTDAAEVLNDDTVDAVFIATRHDLHAGQTAEALRAGKHVFVEKPLAINLQELDEFENALAESGATHPIWTVGFNRRFSAAARAVREHFAAVAGPLTLNYRFNAGAIPADHWTQDRAVGGGRIVGEGCHALDLASFLLNGRIARIHAEAVTSGGSAGGGDDQVVLVLRMNNGSVASICYFAGGDKAFPKERIEVFGGGRVGVIDDFKSVTLADGGRMHSPRLGARDKGHKAELETFIAAVRRGGPPPISYDSLVNVSRATLLAMESLRTGLPVEVPV